MPRTDGPCAGRPAPRRSSSRRGVRVQASSVSDLKKFDIPGLVEVTEGLKGSTKMVLKHGCGSSAEVSTSASASRLAPLLCVLRSLRDANAVSSRRYWHDGPFRMRLLAVPVPS